MLRGSMLRRRVVVIGLLGVGSVGIAACTLLVDTTGLSSGSVPSEGPLPDVDVDREAATERDAADADAIASPPVYNDITDPKYWQAVDLATVDTGTRHYRGGVFDGRSLYLLPRRRQGLDGRIVRFDTTAALDAPTSWSAFDLTSLNGAARGFFGGAFDGRFTYFFAHGGVAVRGDTQGSFGSAGSWSIVDPRPVTGKIAEFCGAVFDGRYVYAIPFENSYPDGGSSTANLAVTRIDTTSPFTQSAASFFDLAPVYPTLEPFHGGTFDGRYVYFVSLSSRNLVRYDTQGSFASASSWQLSSYGAVAGGGGHAGATFDGRYVYLVPSASGRVVRYDTQAPFGQISSFTAFDAASARSDARGYLGATFDGRFIYFAPHSRVPKHLEPHGVVTRYDTQAPFQSGSSWSFFDMATWNASARDFAGAVFDGRHVYFVPKADGRPLVRFDARSPAALPPRWNASFF